MWFVYLLKVCFCVIIARLGFEMCWFCALFRESAKLLSTRPALLGVSTLLCSVLAKVASSLGERLTTAQFMARLRPSQSDARSASRVADTPTATAPPSPMVRNVNSDFKGVVRNVIQSV